MSSTSASTSISAAPPNRAWVGWVIALCASTCFSVATPISRAALTSGLGANEMMVARMGMATLLMGLTIVILNWRLLLVDRRCLVIATAAGTLNGIGMYLFWLGLGRLTSSMTAMLVALSPIFVLTLLWLRGERVTYRHAIRVALALIGVYLLIGPGGEVDLIGVGWILLSLVCFALQLTMLQWFLMRYDARPVTFYVLLAMTVCAVVIWRVGGGGEWQPLGTYGWVVSFVLALVSTYASRLLLFSAVSRIGGGQMAMLSPVETLLSVIWSFIFLDERLLPIQWIGGFFILVSAMLAIQRLSIARFRPRWRLWVKS